MRISHDEVSVSHPDAVKKLYLNPVPKGYWYKGTALPDYRFEAPMAILNPKAKMELSRVLSPPYSQSESSWVSWHPPCSPPSIFPLSLPLARLQKGAPLSQLEHACLNKHTN